MSKQRYDFTDTNFRSGTTKIIEQADEILTGYTSQGLIVTVRQLYYQFVARGLIPNTEQSYKKIIDIVGKARLAGLLDWDAIEDRGRVPEMPSEWSSIESIVDSAVRSFRLPRWKDQGTYPEVWVEKQALAGVLGPLTDRLHVTLMVNKGYSSLSAMRESAMRFMDRTGQKTEFGVSHGQKDAVLFYVGDHDPSGEDMVRDVRERLTNFGVTNLRVVKIALTMEQIRQYKPPPNPAKVTDSRFEAYRKKYGDESWELDALDPKTLQNLIETAVTSVMKVDVMKEMMAEEKRQRERLRDAMATMSGATTSLQDVLDVLRSAAEGCLRACYFCHRLATRISTDGDTHACDEHAECDCKTVCRGLCRAWNDLPHAGLFRTAMKPARPG